MTKHLFYLIGVPGAGKSTLSRALVPAGAVSVPKPFWHRHFNGVAILGKGEGDYPGTDTLSMSVQPKVLDWLNETPYHLVYGEGDRLANDRFFRSVQAAGWNLTVACLFVDEATGEARRRMRGSTQNPQWLKGRSTKVLKLLENWVQTQWMIDGCPNVQAIAESLPSHPVLQALGWV